MTRLRLCITALAASTLLLLTASAARSLHALHDLKEVPFSRLLANAEMAVANDGGAAALSRLARIHGMAYAWKLAPESRVTVQGDKAFYGTPSDQTWVPYRQPAGDYSWMTGEPKGEPVVSPAEEALAHLDRAIELYREALAQTSDSDVARGRSLQDVLDLGMAWCLRERALHKPEARAADSAAAAALLRPLVVRSSRAGPQSSIPYSLGPIFALEATNDLIRLIESGDVEPASPSELSDLRGTVADILKWPRAITPLALDLGGAEAAPRVLVDESAEVAFDLDGSGRRLEWTWIKPRAAWLVWDPRGIGEIRGALQFFGNRTFNLFHTDGFAALSLLDDNGDHVLRGSELDGLAVWRDVDSDGVSSPSEVTPLAELGIVELETRPEVGQNGWLTAPGGARKADGSSHDIWDLILETAGEETTSVTSDWMKAGEGE